MNGFASHRGTVIAFVAARGSTFREDAVYLPHAARCGGRQHALAHIRLQESHARRPGSRVIQHECPSCPGVFRDVISGGNAQKLPPIWTRQRFPRMAGISPLSKASIVKDNFPLETRLLRKDPKEPGVIAHAKIIRCLGPSTSTLLHQAFLRSPLRFS